MKWNLEIEDCDLIKMWRESINRRQKMESKIRNRTLKTETQIKQDFYEELESHNYSKDEIKKYAGSIKFFVSENAVKRAYNRAFKELDKTLRYTYKKH